MRRSLKARRRAAQVIALTGLGTAFLALAAGHAGWEYRPVHYRESYLPRPAMPRDVGVQYLGYPYGVAEYPTVPDENGVLCLSDPRLHIEGCRLVFNDGLSWIAPLALPEVDAAASSLANYEHSKKPR